MNAPKRGYRNRAFISYTHADTAWASRIQKRIENYRVPKELVGLETPMGKVPDRLYPVFRDRTDVSAGSRMEGLKDELDASQSMILICSPKAAASDPVEKEIIHFKSTRPGARILPIIVDGEPGAKFQAQDCFPKALRMQVRDGKVTDVEDAVPIAADVREQGDREELAVFKLIAGMTGVGLGELMQRNREAEIRERRRWYKISATMAGLFIVASVAAYLAWTTSTKNARMLEKVLTGSSNFVREAVRANKERGLPAGETITFVRAAADMIQNVRSVGNSSDNVMREITSFEMVLADSYGQVNDLEKQTALADAALEQMILLARGRQDPAFRRDLARAYWTKGRSISVMGRNTEALGLFEKCLTETAMLSDDVLLADPELASIVATCHREIGLIDLERNLYAEASVHVQRSLALAKASLERNFNARSLEDVTWSYIHQGELHRQRQNFDEARKTVSEALALLETAKEKNKDLELLIQRFQGNLYIVKGDASLFQAAKVADKTALYEQARADFVESARLREILSSKDKLNVVYANAWAFSLIKVAEASTRLKDYQRAKDAYETARIAVQAPLTRTPDQLQLRRTLNFALAGLSDVLTMMRQRDEAIKYALERIVNDERMLLTDPGSEQRQRSLADGHYYVAQMYEANGQPDMALPHHDKAVEIYTRHATNKPKNIDYQSQLARTLEAKAGIHSKLGQLSPALDLVKRSLELRHAAVELSVAASRRPEEIQQNRRNLANTFGLLARAQLANGACADALKMFTEAEAGYTKVLEQSALKDWQKQKDDWIAEAARAKETCAQSPLETGTAKP